MIDAPLTRADAVSEKVVFQDDFNQADSIPDGNTWTPTRMVTVECLLSVGIRSADVRQIWHGNFHLFTILTETLYAHATSFTENLPQDTFLPEVAFTDPAADPDSGCLFYVWSL